MEDSVMNSGQNRPSNPNVTFRDLEMQDMDRLYVWRNNPAVAEKMYNPKPFTRESH
jgi:hypothetical protein